MQNALKLSKPQQGYTMHKIDSLRAPACWGFVHAIDKVRVERFVILNRNRKLLISRAPTKAKSQEPAYSQALNKNKMDRQRSRSRESGRQTVRRLWWMVFGVETGREAWG